MKAKQYPKISLLSRSNWLHSKLSRFSFKFTQQNSSHQFSPINHQGMTVIEILVVVAIIAVLAMMVMFGFSRQMSKARDTHRKDDLFKIQVAFEDYYNDNNCYPELAILENCGGGELSPYLREIPCDPETNEPYIYFSLGGNQCHGYRVLVALENINDASIENAGCNAIDGCYWDDPAYNLGIAMGGTLTGNNWVQEGELAPTPIPTPTPTPDVCSGQWVISPNGTCSCYSDDYYQTAGCPTAYGTYVECFAVSGCSNSCTEEEVPLSLRCTR